MICIDTFIVGLCLPLVSAAWAGVSRNTAPGPSANTEQQAPLCKAYPGDVDWPSSTHWAELNSTLGGALLIVDPPFSVCHSAWPEYNATECLFLYNNFSNLTLRYAARSWLEWNLSLGLTEVGHLTQRIFSIPTLRALLAYPAWILPRLAPSAATPSMW